jgi:hypothetical protein
MNDKTSSQEKAPVSCWRSLFVANEWNELQTLRVTNLEVRPHPCLLAVTPSPENGVSDSLCRKSSHCSTTTPHSIRTPSYHKLNIRFVRASQTPPFRSLDSARVRSAV